MGWTASDCQTPLEATKPVRNSNGDIYVSLDHPIYNDEPWTQQSMGCGQPGDFIYLPRSCMDVEKIPRNKSISVKNINKLAKNQSIRLGEKIRDQWIRYRFGVFSDLKDSNVLPSVNLDQHALCFGKSVKEIVLSHPDLITSKGGAETQLLSSSSSKKFQQFQPKQKSQPQQLLPPPPKFRFTRAEGSKYVIVLENSQAMNENSHWDVIRRACKKFLLHDAPSDASVALVLFNQRSHIAHSLTTLGNRESRQSLAVQINNKYSLSPKNHSCVLCGIKSAMEALEAGSFSPMGANVILISQGLSTNLGLDDETQVLDMAAKHWLQIYSVAIPSQPQADISMPLERLTQKTGGLSYFIPETSYDKESLATYVAMVDAFREIQARSTDDGPFLIHEKSFAPALNGGQPSPLSSPSSPSSPTEETGSFVIDKYVGRDTQFKVFAANEGEGFVKSITIIDRQGQQYGGLHDTLAAFRTFSVYRVPYELDQNIGMKWTYSVERIPSPKNVNDHIVQVTSRSRIRGEEIKIKFYTNMDLHAIQVRAANPIKLFAEVKLNGAPVIDARVVAHIQGLNHVGQLTDVISIPLYDSGHGDPDLKRDDGIYSRYLTDLSGGEGRYSVTLVVDDNEERAFSFQRASALMGETSSSLSCCKDGRNKIRNEKLRPFKRITKGDSFRIHSISKVPGLFPPARILDLHVDVLTSSQQLEFSWSAPGNDLDQGKTSLYQLYSSENPSIFYTNLNQSKQVDGFNAIKKAGERESHRITVSQFNTNVYYALVSIDAFGNAGEVSNIRQAYMPSPASLLATTVNEGLSSEQVLDSPQHRAVPSSKSEKILLFIIVAVVGFILLCVIMVLVIVFSYRRKKASHSGHNESMRSMGVSTSVVMNDANSTSIVASNSVDNLQSPGYSVCDEQDLIKEQQETNRFLHSYSDMTMSNNGTGTQNSVSFADENPYGNGVAMNMNSTMNRSSTYGWTEFNNPYVIQSTSNTLPTYRDFQNHQQMNGYVPNYYNSNITAPPAPPTYAQPIPKSQRGSNIYTKPTHNSSPAGLLSQQQQQQKQQQQQQQQQHPHHLLHLQSPSGSSQSSTSAQMPPHLGSGDERVPSISPPLEGVSVPLISSSNSNTPTKSILKKPKHYSTNATPSGQESYLHSRCLTQEDQSSQSSSGKDDRFSESSNVSFSDRDTPTIDLATTGMVGPLQPIPPLASQDEDEEDNEEAVDDADVQGGCQPNYSPSNTYLETSFEATTATNEQASSSGKKLPPPTLPKPASGLGGSTELSEKVTIGAASSTSSSDASQTASTGSTDKINVEFSSNTIDRKVRNITQV
ncbi:hypothetical protein TCAL_07999 [Tigriopus californicus]|uniref:VWFA domain-containing protein n=2 Tax=Tigriopus californicus TaxID=6832 RepID=A0A553PEY4_TIGCA|nr:hypothetical protein TCAL_07999 [Tigriopus californicus]